MDSSFNKIVSALREKRQEIASLKKVEVFKILQNKTIEEIAQIKPKTVEELAKIKGIGEAKLLSYGQTILNIVKQFAQEAATERERGSTKAQQSVRESQLDLFSSLSTEVTKPSLETKPSLAEVQKERDKVFSVGEFLAHLNSLLAVREYAVQGEISELKFSSYSIYFSLKDKKDNSVVNCYMSVRKYESLGVSITEGMEVKLKGYPEIYKLSGRLSLIVNDIEPIGEGALRKAYELLKKKLEAEGLYARKRQLPEFIQRIGVISSKNGVVIQDFRKNLKNRGYEIFFCDARVEGPEAPGQIISGIKKLNKKSLDVLVIMRGGGSLESMQAFNNENVVRAIFASDLPVVCGIGHDVDVPIASMVGDLAVSTPTATAHTMNRSWAKLEEGLPILSHRLINRFESNLIEKSNLVESFYNKATGIVSQLSDRLQRSADDLTEYFNNLIDKTNQKLTHAEKILSALNPENQLKLGYSIIFDNTGKVLKSIDPIKIGDMIKVRLQKGSVKAEVKNKE